MPDVSAPEAPDATPCDVLVIGGGPAGSTAAALLAEKGRHVILLEKDRHPRFHIGESLLPMNMPLLERLGVGEAVARIGVIKHGAEFVSMFHNRAKTFYFSDALDKAHPSAYQVRRAEFDEVLLRNCAAKGAEVYEQTRVTQVEFPSAGGSASRAVLEADGGAGPHVECGPGTGALVTATGPDGKPRRWRAKFVVDASGRDTFLASRLGLKARNPRHNSAALFAHFRDAARPEGRDAGNISIYWFEHGWFWVIPLSDGVTSVGAVCWPYYLKSRAVSPEQFFRDTVALCPGVRERLAGAERVSEVTATGNYSYQARRMAGEGYVIVGDAFAFVDPVFSTGVFLAMHSAFRAAAAVDASLSRPRESSRRLAAYDREVRRGIATFSWFIYRVTTPAFRYLILNPSNVWRVRDGVVSLLAGDVFRAGPVRSRLWLFKAIYYAASVAMWKQSWAAYRRRREIIRPVAAES